MDLQHVSQTFLQTCEQATPFSSYWVPTVVSLLQDTLKNIYIY